MLPIYNWEQLSPQAQDNLLQRPANNNVQLYGQVQSILAAVKERGDQALYEFTREFDRVELDALQVQEKLINNAQINSSALTAIESAIENLRIYHSATLPQSTIVNTTPGISIQQIYKPIQSVGLYVPGGNNTPLISSLLMQAIPAEIAKCPIKYLCTPPNSQGEIDPALLVAARLCDVRTIYKVGGAQAIAAMAYGTETIPKVFKIFGPGNAFVTEAKQQVALDPTGAAIDLPAGPSEVMVIANNSANPQFIAADLLAQAEHGPDSQVLLLCDDGEFAHQVSKEVTLQVALAKRKDIITRALKYGSILVCSNLQEQIDIANRYAPEHLIINREDADELCKNILSAGTIFLGQWAAETLGDYITGSNHVLPTNGYAHAYSGLSCKDFMKSLNVQTIQAEAIKAIGTHAIILAKLEGLEAHAQAVQLRLNALE